MTPLERFWVRISRSAGVATGICFLGLVVYVGAGSILLWAGIRVSSYPLLVANRDPLLYFWFGGCGLFLSLSMLGRVISALLLPNREEDVVLLVLLGSIVVGFGVAAFYYSNRVLWRLLG